MSYGLMYRKLELDYRAEDVDCLIFWLQASVLTISVKKTKSMVFSTQYFRGITTLNTNMAEENVEEVTEFKYLGV